MPAFVVLRPDWITAQHVLGEDNAEVRRVMLERMGQESFLRQSGAKPIHEDAAGVLYRIPIADDEPLTLVEVVNSTPEPDGTRKRYILRVPPAVKTARAAVAWTFDLRPSEYRPTVQT